MSETTVYNYYIGLNDKDTHKQIVSTSVMEMKVNTILYAYGLYNYTIKNCKGMFRGESENTLNIFLTNKAIPRVALEDIKKELNQECIMESITTANINFI